MSEQPTLIPHKDAQGQDLDFWTFIDFAVSRMERDIPSIDAETMRLVMGLRRATDTMFYDLHVLLTKDGTISSTGAMRILLILFVAGPCRVQDIANFAGMSRAAVSARTACPAGGQMLADRARSSAEFAVGLAQQVFIRDVPVRDKSVPILHHLPP